MKLSDRLDWRLAPRMWSVRLKALAALLQGWVLLAPGEVLQLWNMLPVQLAERLPARAVLLVPLALFALSAVAQFVKQDKLDGK